VVTLGLANLGTLAFHLAMSRLLDRASYGPLIALIGVLMVVVVPLTAAQTAVTGEVAMRRATAGEVTSIRSSTEHFALIGVAGAAVVLAVAPLARGFLHIGSVMPIVVLGLVLIPALAALAPKGLLLGQGRFRAVSAAVVAGVVTRLTAGIVLTMAGLGLTGAVAATVAAESVACVVLLGAARGSLVDRPEKLHVDISGVVGSIAAFTGFWLLMAIGTVLAQHYLPRAAAGSYSAAATAASGALFLPSALCLVAFPTFAATVGRGEVARGALLQALGVVGVVGGAAAAVLVVFPNQAVTLLFGSSYRGPAATIRALAVASALAGLVGVLLHFHLAARSRATLLAWPGVLAAVAAIAIWHRSPQQLAGAMVATTAAVCAAMLVAVRRSWRAEPGSLPVVANFDLGAPELDLSVVMPYYNPGEPLGANLSRLLAVLHECDVSFEIIPVADGCTDGSDLIVRGWQDPAVRGVVLADHQGKGAALRVGLSVGRGRYVGFIDGDGDIEPGLLIQLVDLIRSDAPDIVFGSKRHPLSQVAYPRIRRLYSWAYQQLIRALFHLDVRDTQTGLKLIRREVLADVLPRTVENRFAFDLELFVLARQLGYRNLVEVPVRIRHQFNSTISLTAVAAMLVDTLAVFYRLRIRRSYSGIPLANGVRVPTG
jgi:O-antigen/teichoic acid export membrane protein